MWALLLIAATSPACAQAPSRFFVAPNGRDTWSGQRSSPAAGGTDGPFATLGTAQAAMRGHAGSRITFVRAGSYFMRAPLSLTGADAGERFMAYPGEHPILFGGLPILPWHSGTDPGTFVTTASPMHAADGLPLLIAGDRMLPNARLPRTASGENHESAWFFADSSPDGIDPHRSFRVRAGDMAAFAAAGPATAITIFGQRGWQDYVFPIKRLDSASRIVTLDGSTWDAIGEGSRFALLNAAASPGTWRFDPYSGAVQSRADVHGPPPSAAVLATLPCIVAMEGVSDVTIAGLRLVGSAAEGAAVCLSHTRRITLDGLNIGDVGDGIRLDSAVDTRITAGEIVRAGGFGVSLRHGSDGTLVEGAWLHDIGWLHQDSSAIWFDASSHNRFMHNRIENVGKFAIGGGSLTDGGAYDNVIEGNEIDHANQRTSDGGGILVIGWAQDATHDVIRGNFVSNTGALGNIGWDGVPHVTFQDPVTRLVSEAIYLDDWASGVQVRGNLLCGNIGGIELHAGWDNQVFDNVLIGNAGIAMAVDAENWLGHGAHPHAMENNSIERNLVFLDRPSTGQSGAISVRGGDGAARFDHNTYRGPGLDAYSFHQEPDHFWSSYSFGGDTWRARGQDGHAVMDGSQVRVAAAALPLDGVGRPQDRAGLAERVRRRCKLQ